MLSTKKTMKTIDYKKEEISHVATELLQGEHDKKYLVDETRALLSWVKSVYPNDYEIYIEDEFKVINESNVVKALKKTVSMCTFNSL